MALKSLDDLEVAGRRVLVRSDLNVTLREGAVVDDTRLRRSARTISILAERGARVVVISHLGRPNGRREPGLSLRPVAESLAHSLYMPVRFAEDCVGPAAEAAVTGLADGQVALLENLRFHPGEAANDHAFAQRLAQLADCYVNDAFSTCHRAHASIVTLPALLPAAAGYLLQEEVTTLTRLLSRPERPFAALIGGAKVAAKIGIIDAMLERLDVVAVGGVMANTFLQARGIDTAGSRVAADKVADARHILDRTTGTGTTLVLPSDVTVARSGEAASYRRTVPVEEVPPGWSILDIGTASADRIIRRLGECRTAVWSGPMGAAEITGFDTGTVRIAHALAELTKAGRLVSVVGGGDTLASIVDTGTIEDFTHASTAGSAFLAWLHGQDLPGLQPLTATLAARARAR